MTSHPLRHPERSEGSSHNTRQDLTGFFRLRRQNDEMQISRIHWMFRGYASQHDEMQSSRLNWILRRSPQNDAFNGTFFTVP